MQPILAHVTLLDTGVLVLVLVLGALLGVACTRWWNDGRLAPQRARAAHRRSTERE